MQANFLCSITQTPTCHKVGVFIVLATKKEAQQEIAAKFTVFVL
jgi:hypothetical protein